jgi:hypothetical protein
MRLGLLVALASALGLLGDFHLIGRAGAAELAKQGSFSGHDAWSGVIEGVLVLGEKHVIYNYSFNGVVTVGRHRKLTPWRHEELTPSRQGEGDEPTRQRR